MKILAILGLTTTLALSGCITPGTDVITPQQLIVAGNAFDAMEVTAANYLRLPVCPQATICRTQAVSSTLVVAVRNARYARSKLEAYVNTNPGQPLPVNLYQTVETAVVTLQNILIANNIQ